MSTLPAFDAEGNLPPGVWGADWEEFNARFGRFSPRRAYLVHRLARLLKEARSTGELRRVFVWGSFVTSKIDPGDVDLLLVMAADFRSDDLTGTSAIPFDHIQARLAYSCDVFWMREESGNVALGFFLDAYQTDRAQNLRGIVEITE